MQGGRLSFHGFGQIPDRHYIVIYRVLLTPRIPSPQTHVGPEEIVEPSSTLVVVCGSANHASEVVEQPWPVRCWHIGRGQKLCGRRIPALLGNGHVGPRHVGRRVGIEAARRERIARAELRGAVRIGSVWHVNRNGVVREVSVFYVGHRHRSAVGEVSAVRQSLVSSEEKQLVPHNPSTASGPKLIALKRRLWSAGAEVDIVEEVFRVQRAVSQKVVGRAMKLVGSPFGYRVDLSGAPAELCGV